MLFEIIPMFVDKDFAFANICKLRHARTFWRNGAMRMPNKSCRPHGVKVVCLVSNPSGGSSELACAMRINLVIQIILAC